MLVITRTLNSHSPLSTGFDVGTVAVVLTKVEKTSATFFLPDGFHCIPYGDTLDCGNFQLIAVDGCRNSVKIGIQADRSIPITRWDKK